jgi:hypothetical protein
METFDSQGRILPVGPADQNMVSKKITDKEGQGQEPRHHQQRSAGSAQSGEGEENSKTTEHVIDIIV